MASSGRELDKQATRLVRRAIVHHSMDKGYRTGDWPRDELLDDGYSQAVVRKAKYLDAATVAQQGWFVPVWALILSNDFAQGKYSAIEKMLGLATIIIALVIALHRLYHCRLIRPTSEDDQLVIAELSARLGPETIQEAFYADDHALWRNPQPRKALLWRLDAFLSRKPVDG